MAVATERRVRSVLNPRSLAAARLSQSSNGKYVMQSKPHCCLFVLLVLSVSACSWSDKGDTSVAFPSSPVKSIELTVVGLEDADPQMVTFTTEADIKPIMAVLLSGCASEDHGCPSVGHLRILHADSSTTGIGILPGHSEEYYEFRYRGTNYRVLREDLPRRHKQQGIRQRKVV
jgi:hypothetical protein